MLRLLATRRLGRSTVGRGALLGKAHGFARALSSKPFNLADIGEGIAEVEVLQWFVKPDDSVEQVCACGSLSYGAIPSSLARGRCLVYPPLSPLLSWPILIAFLSARGERTPYTRALGR